MEPKKRTASKSTTNDKRSRRFTADQEERIFQNMVSEVRDGSPNEDWHDLFAGIAIEMLERASA